MPVKSVSWAVGNQTFLNLKDAQTAEISEMLKGQADVSEQIVEAFAELVVNNSEKIVAILSIKDSKRKPRSDKGKSHRKLSAEAVNRALQDGKQ